MEKFIVDFNWSQKIPYLVMADSNTNAEMHDNYIIGKTLTIKFINNIRFCPGYIDLITGNKYNCPKSSVLENSKEERCDYCEDRIGFVKGFLYGRYTNSVAREYFNMSHYIYLAYFYPGIIKVGTASEVRKTDRLYEQGADAYCLIAKISGVVNAQIIEKAISNSLKLTMMVRKNVKALYLNAEIDKTEVQKQLENTFINLKRDLRETRVLDYLFPEIDIVFVKRFGYIQVNSIIHLIEWKDVSLFSGTIIDIKGCHIIFINRGVYFALNAKKLTGYTVDYSEKLTPIETFVNQYDLFDLNLSKIVSSTE